MWMEFRPLPILDCAFFIVSLLVGTLIFTTTLLRFNTHKSIITRFIVVFEQLKLSSPADQLTLLSSSSLSLLYCLSIPILKPSFTANHFNVRVCRGGFARGWRGYQTVINQILFQVIYIFVVLVYILCKWTPQNLTKTSIRR